LAKIIHFAHNG